MKRLDSNCRATRGLFFPWIIVSIILCIRFTAFSQDIKVLVNHIGYEAGGPKNLVVQAHAGDEVSGFAVIDYSTGKNVLTGSVTNVGGVDQWKDWKFWSADFDALTNEGTFVVECQTSRGVVRSFPFLVQKDLFERNILSSVIYYFKGQRSSGLLDKADRHIHAPNSTNTIDVHGGWYDATGDYGKHLGGMGFSTYFNMQPTPLADWSLFKTYEALNTRGDVSFRQFKRRVLDEAMYGADFLVRMKHPGGSFLRTVDAPGPAKRPEDRVIG
ncbi:MAG TPA: glycoside hydrolase family 9 protein, partial [Verrucomicrobiae bacterium]|nr:glycoside hydrolase family 9 protein [Verrucomicrobiae bacterium]